ncbi:TIGR02757 family protein [Holophaga foetida]|uniref:TIGR02757 family protein n=1 Tax=Holophaga foetida TaxID=35839 RepID=UPI00130EDCBC|nr:TIGR02757 family protein [Holophaga foetida]
MKNALQALRTHYDTSRALDQDPLVLAMGYPEPWDRELAAFVAAHLAYGRVAPMLRAIRSAMEPLGDWPAHRLRAWSEVEAERHLEEALPDWKWRFHTRRDLVAWILAWKRLDQESGLRGLEPHLLPGPELSADQALSRLVQRLRKELPPTHGLRFCLPDPLEGSACKRWRLFLRWMVRRGWPDLGQWTDYPPSSLVIPLDTHVARISRLLGLTSRTASDGRTAREITEALRELEPQDPLSYDFAISHLGILGDCNGVAEPVRCSGCALAGVCSGGYRSRSAR